MIEIFIGTYLIVGLIVALVIWHTVFQPDYDEFVERNFEETPPTTSQKWFVVLVTPLIWPITLYRVST
jgi:ATP/ADP translocase